MATLLLSCVALVTATLAQPSGTAARSGNGFNKVKVAGYGIDEYFRICRENPLTAPLEGIPLPWFQPPGRRFSAGSPVEQAASEWLQQPTGLASPQGQLLAAAILASSSTPSSRTRGEEWLKRLALSPPKEEKIDANAAALYETRVQVARLATALLWKSSEKMLVFDSDTAKATKNDREVENREKLVVALPEPLRAGPYYLLGETYERLRRDDEAVLAWMRLPTNYPEDRPLAAQALYKAARTLVKLGRYDQAATLRREIEMQYADFDWAVQAAGTVKTEKP